MKPILVWVLINMSGYGTATTLGYFPTEADCQQVKRNIPKYPEISRCIQSTMYIAGPTQGGSHK